ncbi:hypothetical protein OLMES_2159 [Oleiphilus messinensis]|uniref:Uncharacterized protein n=1 Tax=Oleiphilus messinensis TaxID=141451 RepID=A0A1Y0I7Q7_9GAMM|nr:hypothetical protein OLMES_2159 [Oleiphilus messinensis]
MQGSWATKLVVLFAFRMILHTKLNYRNIALHADNAGTESVACRLRSGQYRYYVWLGFIDIKQAARLAHSKPVKLKVWAYHKCENDSRVELKSDDHVQGCLVDNVVFCVLNEGRLRIV